MSSSKMLGLAARMHLLLRRTTGRVTDIEWLASNAEYAEEIIRFARSRTIDDKTSELAQLADHFEQVISSTSKFSHPEPPTSITAAPKGTRSEYLKTQLGSVLDERAKTERYVHGLR
jgi:ElaB/YqjD/DUF883 family membrane-anchored ribosome-binding protein